MPTDKKAASTYLAPERHARLSALAAEQGQTVSVFLSRLIELVLEEQAPQETPVTRRSRARREGKVTVRLAEDVRTALDTEAKGQGVTVSTWAATLLSARMRSAPQMPKNQRRQTIRGFRQLHGMAVNVNQIAYALNRGVLTGAGAELTAQEVRRLSDAVAELRRELRLFASGRYQFQVPDERGVNE